jgi:hypothetical protein
MAALTRTKGVRILLEGGRRSVAARGMLETALDIT